MLEVVFLTLGTSSLLIAYTLYGMATRRGLVAPNRASWLIWSATTTTEALTYNALNAGAAQNIVFLLSSIACIAVTISVWRHSKWQRPTALESVCMASSIAALVIWLGFQNTFWAHVLVLIVIPISFLPTWASLRKDPSQEQSPAWGLWTVSDLATLGFIMLVTKGGGNDLPYILIELVCHASVWAMIGFATINPFNAFKIVNYKFMMHTHDPDTGQKFLLGRNHLGKSVYAGQAFTGGQEIVRFKGQIHTRKTIPGTLHDANDRYVQIGEDAFMGPSDGIDDLINHSCNPNAGLRFLPTGPVLIALGPISLGQELSWDYSTTIYKHEWSMTCKCRSPHCRGTIGEFQSLSPDVKDRYRGLHILPDYVLAASS